MSGNEWLAEQFEASRAHLRAVAYRMLGSAGEADDAVQECWLRVSRADSSAVENLEGWLTTALARICLNVLRSRKSRREEPLRESAAHPVVANGKRSDPEDEALLAESVGLALLVILERLTPGRTCRLRAARRVRYGLRRNCSYREALPGGRTTAREPRSSPHTWKGNAR